MIRTEGEIWTEKGKTWTIKNGIKKSVSKFNTIRKNLRAPLCCPKCNKSMKSVDEQVYKFNNVCLDCTIEFEHELKIAGKYDDYEKARVLANAKGYVIDLERFLKDYVLDTNNASYVTEDGEVEAWIGDSSKRASELVEPELEKIKKQIYDK